MKNKILTLTFVISLTSSALFAFSLGDVANSLSNANEPAATTAKTTAKTTEATTSTSSLTDMLTDQLGITNTQASGGVGSILTYAKSALTPNKFSTLSSAIPDASSLMSMAPSSDTSTLSSLTGSLEGKSSSATQLAALTSQFSSLGLSSDMVSKFIPIILNYFKDSGATDASSILSGLF